MARSHRVVSLRFGTDKRSQELARQVLEVLRDKDGDEDDEEQDSNSPGWTSVPWSRWYKQAREKAKSEYGIRRVAKDVWREQWAMGNSVQTAVEQIRLRYGHKKGGSR